MGKQSNVSHIVEIVFALSLPVVAHIFLALPGLTIVSGLLSLLFVAVRVIKVSKIGRKN